MGSLIRLYFSSPILLLVTNPESKSRWLSLHIFYQRWLIGVLLHIIPFLILSSLLTLQRLPRWSQTAPSIAAGGQRGKQTLWIRGDLPARQFALHSLLIPAWLLPCADEMLISTEAMNERVNVYYQCGDDTETELNPTVKPQQWTMRLMCQ